MGSRTQRHQQKAAEAYWQRRVFMLVGSLFAVGVIAWSCSGAGGMKTAGSQPRPAPTVTVTATVTAPQVHWQVPAEQRCKQDDIEVRVGASSERYGPGQRPRFTVVVANKGDRACKRDVGSEALTLVAIDARGRIVWNSDHCGTADPLVATLSPGEEYQTHLSWDRTVTEPGCPRDRQPAPAGKYKLVGGADGVRSQLLQFYLR